MGLFCTKPPADPHLEGISSKKLNFWHGLIRSNTSVLWPLSSGRPVAMTIRPVYIIKIKWESRSWRNIQTCKEAFNNYVDKIVPNIVLSCDFPGPRTYAVSLTSLASATHWPLQPQIPYFTKKLLDPDGWIIPCTKMTNTGQPMLFSKNDCGMYPKIPSLSIQEPSSN